MKNLIREREYAIRKYEEALRETASDNYEIYKDRDEAKDAKEFYNNMINNLNERMSRSK